MSEKTLREQGIAAINAGGSFFWNNKQYVKLEDVPSDEEFAGKPKPEKPIKEVVEPAVEEETVTEDEVSEVKDEDEISEESPEEKKTRKPRK